MPKRLYIFDLDGTLALIDHRRHFVEGEKKNWPAFFAACIDDVPNHPIIYILKTLQREAEIWVWSGRSNEVEKDTICWLRDYGIRPARLRMRKEGDHRPDDALKLAWVKQMKPEDRDRLVAVFDDRNRIVKMWREQGITCLQVAPGDF